MLCLSCFSCLLRSCLHPQTRTKTSGITAAMMPTSDLFRLLATDGLTCVIAVCDYVERLSDSSSTTFDARSSRASSAVRGHAVNAGLSCVLRCWLQHG